MRLQGGKEVCGKKQEAAVGVYGSGVLFFCSIARFLQKGKKGMRS